MPRSAPDERKPISNSQTLQSPHPARTNPPPPPFSQQIQKTTAHTYSTEPSSLPRPFSSTFIDNTPKAQRQNQFRLKESWLDTASNQSYSTYMWMRSSISRRPESISGLLPKAGVYEPFFPPLFWNREFGLRSPG